MNLNTKRQKVNDNDKNDKKTNEKIGTRENYKRIKKLKDRKRSK